MRRAVEVGDGWLGFNVSPEEAHRAIDRMRKIATETGRDFATLDISAGPYSKLPRVDLDSLKRYRDTGVQRVVLINTATRLEQIDAALEEMGNTLVHPAQPL